MPQLLHCTHISLLYLDVSRDEMFQLFIDFTQANDSLKWKAVLDVMKEYGILKKLQNLGLVTLQERKGNEKVQGELSGEFIINRDLRQGDVLSADLFILILGKVIKETEVNKGGMIFLTESCNTLHMHMM